MTVKLIFAFITAAALAALIGPFYIPWLRKLKFGQTERYNGPQSHLVKNGTPTIGGLIFLTPLVLITFVAWLIGAAEGILPLILVTLGFGVIGFLDDFLKIKKKSKDGLSPAQKMAGLVIVSLLFSLYYYFFTENAGVVFAEFFGLHGNTDIGWLVIPLSVLVLLSSTNSVNLTDGLDGLAAGCSIIVFGFFALVSAVKCDNFAETLFAVTAIGSLCGFMIFNYHPAKVFMGDTGSLALGGALGACGIILARPFLIIGAGLLFVLEAVSVILQVGYFKYTKKKNGEGRKLFKMAPLHHHFEQSGWKELKVTFVFWAFTLVCCIATYAAVVL